MRPENYVHASMHMTTSSEARDVDAASAAKCLQDGHNPRNNFTFEALIWAAGNLPARPGGF
jgi:hypothetical protein